MNSIPWESSIPLSSYNQKILSSKIKDIRDYHIKKGITVAGMRIPTDEQTQSRIMGAALQGLIDPNYTVKWKTLDGFILLDSSQVIGIAQAIRSHIQACFDREAELRQLILEDQPFELDSGWPS